MSNTNDLIRRGDAIDAVYSRIKQIGCENNVDVLSIRQAVREVQSVQPEQPTRCAHCKRYDLHNHRCKWWNHGVSNVDWCSYAERRNDD